MDKALMVEPANESGELEAAIKEIFLAMERADDRIKQDQREIE